MLEGKAEPAGLAGSDPGERIGRAVIRPFEISSVGAGPFLADFFLGVRHRIVSRACLAALIFLAAHGRTQGSAASDGRSSRRTLRQRDQDRRWGGLPAGVSPLADVDRYDSFRPGVPLRSEDRENKSRNA